MKGGQIMYATNNKPRMQKNASWVERAKEKIEKEIEFQKVELRASLVEFRARNPRCLACLEGAINLIARLGFEEVSVA
jgi:hypothetical protein